MNVLSDSGANWRIAVGLIVRPPPRKYHPMPKGGKGLRRVRTRPAKQQGN